MHFRNNLFRVLARTLALLLISSCAKSTAPQLSVSEFADLYAQLVVAAVNPARPDTSALAAQDSLLRSRGLTRQQFADLLEHYAEDPASWLVVTRRTLAALDSVSQAVTEKHLNQPQSESRRPLLKQLPSGPKKLLPPTVQTKR